MKGDPTYNLFIYGLSDENQEFMGRPATAYADSFVSNLLYSKAPEAADAMVAITIWMQVAHSLHSAHGACKMSEPSTGRHLKENDPALYIDVAAAYWIGDNQNAGSSSQGHLLYALTEFIGEKFEKIASGSESSINTQIVDLFNKAKSHITISRGCSTSDGSHLQLKEIVDELIPLMAVPLIRCLIYYLSVDNPAMVKVYATAVLPLFSACAPATYYELKDELIDHSVSQFQKEYIYSKIQSMYSCLGKSGVGTNQIQCVSLDLLLTMDPLLRCHHQPFHYPGLSCESVGFKSDDDSSRCVDNLELKSLAGYKYTSEQEIVNQASHIDVDMRKIEIFISNGMKHFTDSQELLIETAFDLYKYGQHPKDVRGSLSSIARNTRRDVVPMYADFRNYFDNDAYYADTMIVRALWYLLYCVHPTRFLTCSVCCISRGARRQMLFRRKGTLQRQLLINARGLLDLLLDTW